MVSAYAQRDFVSLSLYGREGSRLRGVIKMAGPVAEKVSTIMQATAAGVVIMAAIGGGLTYMTGGWKPTTQVSVDQLSTKLADLTASVDAVKTKLDTSVDGFKSRLDQFPRVADYAAHTTQLEAMARRIDEMGARITRDEIEASANKALLDGILHPSLPPTRMTR